MSSEHCPLLATLYSQLSTRYNFYFIYFMSNELKKSSEDGGGLAFLLFRETGAGPGTGPDDGAGAGA